MVNLGLGEKWVGWIKSCISTSRISVLVNGSPIEEFSPQKGLRQGDPLSPFLFNIAAKGLNLLMERAKETGLIRGASVGPNALKISHLQFADDTIIFCDAEWEEIIMIKRILRCFEVMSGLKINFHRSTVCGIGVEEMRVIEFATKLNCLSQRLPLTYLGLPLDANPRSRSTWQPMVEKFKKKLASWKRRFLSFVGRLTLIRSVLSSLPLFFLSLFKMPVGVAKTTDKIQSSFLWGDSETSRKIHLVNWKEVTMDKNNGGLGIRDLRLVNQCMLLKWWWRFAIEEGVLWKSVVCSKYGYSGGKWWPSVTDLSLVSKIWRDIVDIAQSSPNLFSFFVENTEITIEDGRRIRFWDDNWFSKSSLRTQFPRLYQLSTEKGSSLSKIQARRDLSNKWLFSFRRTLYA